MLTRERKQALYDLHLEELRRRFDPENKKGMISLNKAAIYLGVDPRSLMAVKHFPITPIGKQSRVSLVALAQWIADKEAC